MVHRSIVVLGAVTLAAAASAGASITSESTAAAQEAAASAAQSPRDQMLARAKALEFPTKYVPPPGDPARSSCRGFREGDVLGGVHNWPRSGFRRRKCRLFHGAVRSAREAGKACRRSGAEGVRVAVPDDVTRVARYLGSQGCVTLPVGRNDVLFSPVGITNRLGDATSMPWPMGDVVNDQPLPPEVDSKKVKQAVEAAFDPPDALTAAFVVTWKGRLIGERYTNGATMQTALESWSMGKSITATLMGILIQQGVYTLDQPAPIPEWQQPGDDRAKIRIADLLHMSSGLRIRGPEDPDLDPSLGYLDHLYLYTGSVNSYQYAATRPQQWPPNTVGRYRNTDPVLVNYLVRLAVEKRGEDYLSFPQRALFDKLGMRHMVLETDPYGNFLLQGYELGTGRDWARLGNLYLQGGVWNGERILPADYVRFVSTVAPAWQADGRPVYGGFFWINGQADYPIPKEAYYMSGAGNQKVFIIPSRDLVVVRLGHFKGEAPGEEALKRALAVLMEAVPPHR